ncbi:MAG: recombinase family protein [Alphaproteobacteria bacterium]|nr:recombinase family protein [Alphaproteobacteria bacterium]
MIYGYARVSTQAQAKDGNSLESQSLELRKTGAEKIFSDAFTGTVTERPELDRLLAQMQFGDTIVVTKLDRIARNLKQGIELIDTLNECGITVNVLNMGVIDNTPTGKLIRNIMLSLAEWERDMIIQRTQEGKHIARQNPEYREGRPRKYNKAQTAHALDLLKTHSYRQVANMTGISKATLVRMKSAMPTL